MKEHLEQEGQEKYIFNEWCKFIFEVYCYPTVRISVHSRQYRHSSVQLCVITKQLRRLSFFKWRGGLKELGSSSWAYSGASMYNWWTDGFWKEVNKRKKTSSCLEQPFLVAEVNEKRNKKSFEAAAGNLLAVQCCLLPIHHFKQCRSWFSSWEHLKHYKITDQGPCHAVVGWRTCSKLCHRQPIHGFCRIHSFSVLAERTRCRVNYLLCELYLD